MLIRSIQGVVLALGLLISAAASAQSGQLNHAFGTHGIVSHPINNVANESVRGVAVYPSTSAHAGKTVLVGDGNESGKTQYVTTILRLNADGTLDTTFNGTGKQTLDYGGSVNFVKSVSIQSDDKILVLTAHQITTSPFGQLGLTRYNADGSLDTSFGSGGTYVGFPGGNAFYPSSGGMALQKDGKILVPGNTGSSSCLVRVAANGTSVEVFSVDMRSYWGYGGSDQIFYAVALDDAGAGSQTIYAVGAVQVASGGKYKATAIQFNSSGAIVGTPKAFEYDDTASLAGSSALSLVYHDFGGAIGPRLVVGGGQSGTHYLNLNYFGLALLSPSDLSFYTGFSGDGRLTGNISGGSSVNNVNLQIQSDHKILLGGSVSSRFVCARYNTDGSLDGTFGDSGYINYLNGTGYPTDFCLDNSGNNIVVSHITYNSANTITYFSAIKFHALDAAMAYVLTDNTGFSTDISRREEGQILRLQICMDGSLSPLNATAFAFNTNGSTNPSVDIASAKVYYTGSSSTFASTTQFGSTYNSPNGAFTISGSQALTFGENYFWLVYKMPDWPTAGNYVDAECSGITIGGSAKTPSTTAPTGARKILPVIYPEIYADNATDYLSNVTFAGINNTSTGGTIWMGYSDYTTTTAAGTVTAGQSYSFSATEVSADWPTYPTSMVVWCDWNQDYDFEESDECYLVTSGTIVSSAPQTRSILVPTTATPGTTRMRVVMFSPDISVGFYPYEGDLVYGEAEDYALTVSALSVVAPTTQAHSLVFSGVSDTQMKLDWTSGDGARRAVFLLEGNSGAPAPVDGTTYAANPVFPSGDPVGSSGWYCVYNGVGTSVTLTGLTAGTTYCAMVCEYNGAAGSEKYLTSTASNNPRNQATLNVYALQISATHGTVAKSPDQAIYAQGTMVTLTATAATGYHFTGWTGDVNSSANPLVVTMDSTKTLTANFAINTYGLTVNATNGTVGKSPSQATYNHGTVVTLTATSATGYHFTGWTGDATTSTNPLLVTMDSTRTLTANFAINTYGLTVNATNGTVGKSPDQAAYNHGTIVTLTATPATGYHFTGWTGDATSSTNPLLLTMDSTKTLTANFAINTYGLTVNATNGTVGKSPDQATYNHGTTVTLTATPDTGYHFIGWFDGVTTRTANPLDVAMDATKTLTAYFAINKYGVTVTAAGTTGTVSVSPDQATYAHGTTVTLTATPDAHYHFTGWTGSTTSTLNPLEVAVTSTMTLTANFAIDEYPLTLYPDLNGSASKSPDQTSYTYGTTVTLTATPNTGYHFLYWLDGTTTVTANPYEVTMDSTRTLAALFEIDDYALTVNADANGSVLKSPDQTTYTYGLKATLTAVPDTGYHFTGWTGDVTTSTNPLVLVMDSTKTLTAHFAVNVYELTVQAGANGSVSKSPDQTTCTYGTTVTLTATPDFGYYFSGWTGDVTSSTNPLVLTMDSTKTLTANFAIYEYMLQASVTSATQGYLIQSPLQTTYTLGTTVTLAAEVRPGYRFSNWTGDVPAGQETSPTLVFAMDSTKTLVARYRQVQAHLPIQAWGYNVNGQCTVPSPNREFVSFSASQDFSLGLKSDGSVVAWGDNTYGQCTAPSPNSGFVAVAAGYSHSLGLKSDGSIVAWGDNTYGQCTVPSPNSDFVAVATAYNHSLGLKSDGSVVAWGNNDLGQCTLPSPNEGFVAVAAGYGHSLGLKSDGSIVAWGNNGDSQCDVPVPNSGFVAIAAGLSHSLGLKWDGSVAAWGWNYYGQCNVSAPNSDFVAVSGGLSHSLGLKSDGSVVAWGGNDQGQCNLPTLNRGFVALAAGAFHSLALGATSGTLLVTLEPPEAVAAGAQWRLSEDTAGGWHDSGTSVTFLAGECTIEYKALAGWHEPVSQTVNLVGEQQTPVTGVYLHYFLTTSATQGYVMPSPWQPGYQSGTTVTLLAQAYPGYEFSHWSGDVPAGQEATHPLVITMDAEKSLTAHFQPLRPSLPIRAWGGGFYGQCSVPSPNREFVSVAAGSGHSLGLKADGSVFTWGLNQEGQLSVPSPNSGFVSIAAGEVHSLGLKADGSVVAWGSNGWGQCSVPLPNNAFKAIAASYLHNLGLKSDGSVVAWGSNSSGQSDVPAPNSGFVAVAAGQNHSLGLKSDGSVVAWGDNASGQCTVPSPNSGFLSIAAGQNHSLGLKSDGSVVAWGDNSYNQCTVPSPNSGFVAVAAGTNHSLALKSDGSVVAWGNDDAGQCSNLPVPNRGFVALAGGVFHSLALGATSGTLLVTLEPSAAGAAGAQWRLSDEAAGVWHDSGTTVTHLAGDYTLEFKALPLQWQEPASQPVTLVGEQQVSATGTYVGYTLSVSASHGSVVKSPDLPTYAPGTTVTLTAAPPTGYYFTGWSGATTGTTHPLVVAMDSSKALVAHFTAYEYPLTVEAENGSVAQSPDQPVYPYGTTVTLTATPAVGYHFTGWTGATTSSLNPLDVVVDSTKTLTASFAINTYGLTVNATNGSVSKSPDQTAYNHGMFVTLTATPAAGYHFTGWTGDVTSTANPLSVAMDSTKTLTANFSINTYELTATSSGHGAVSKSPDQVAYNHGSVVRLTATPETGYHFTGWTGDVTSAANPLDVTMDSTKTVTATFAINTYALTVSAANGSVTRAPDQALYNYGTTVTLTAKPATGYRFSGWTGAVTSTQNPLVVTMDSAKSLTANFILQGYELNVVAVNGSVSKSPDQAVYSHGTVVALTATPETGYHFAGWTGDTTSTVNPLSVTMDSTKTLTAHFAINTYAVNVLAAAHGTAAKAPDLAVYPYGSTITLTATPAVGYHFTGWSGTMSSQKNPLVLTVDSTQTLTAGFAINSYPLSVIAENCKVSKSPDQTVYEHGSAVILTATPDAFYQFVGWSGSATGTTNPLTLTMDSTKTLTARFETIEYDLAAQAVDGRVAVSPFGARQTRGTTVTLFALPNPGYSFLGWVGDVPFGQESDNPLKFSILADTSVTAVFEPVSGPILAWGSNSLGQRDVPQPNSGYASIASGYYHSLAVKADGSVAAWGQNESGQCDLPTTNTGFVAVAAGFRHSLGLKAGGSVVGWGENYSGECTAPEPNTSFTAVSAGFRYSMGLKRDGSVVVWGSDNNAALKTVPEPNTGFVAISAGYMHCLALKADGTIVAWGNNDSRQTQVPAPNADFVAVAAGMWFSLGLKADGSIVAWGQNDQGQCRVPAPNTGFVGLAAGSKHGLGLKSSGSLVAWGDNRLGQCVISEPNIGCVAISAGAEHSLAIKTGGLLKVTLTPAEAVAAGAQWRLSDETVGVWHNSGASVSLLAGTFTLEFKDVVGWDTPTTRSVTIRPNEFTEASATYGRHVWTLTTSSTLHGSIQVSSEGTTFTHGTSVTLTAKPDEGYLFVGWQGDVPVGQEKTNPLTLVMDSDKSVKAVFEFYVIQYPLSVAVAGTGSGSVQKAPDQTLYDAGTTVTLTATPAVGSSFSGWLGDVPAGREMENPLVMVMDSTRTLTATFSIGGGGNQYSLQIATAGTGSGTVQRVPEQVVYAEGTTVSLTPLPALDSAFTGWTGDVPAGQENANPLVVTMDATRTLTAVFTRDAVAPSVAVSSPVDDPTSATVFPVTVTFSEPVTGFTAEDLVTSNAVVSNFAAAQGASVYTFDLMVTATRFCQVTVDVPAGAAFDVADNPNTAAPRFVRSYEVPGAVAPTVQLTSNVVSPTNSRAIPVTVTFDQDVTDFAAGDLALGNATAQNFTALDARTYGVELVPVTDGEVTVTVPADVALSSVGMGNRASTTTLTFLYDGTAPTALLSAAMDNPTSVSRALVKVTFSEPVTTLTLAGIEITGGTARNLVQLDTRVYGFVVDTQVDGEVTIRIKPGAVLDEVGNANPASAPLTWTFDTLAPQVTLSAVEKTSETRIPVSVTFSEPVKGFEVSDLVTSGGVAQNLVEVSETGLSYTFDFVVTTTKTATLLAVLPGGSCTDRAGNANAASVPLAIFYEPKPPVLLPLDAPTSVTASDGEFNYRIAVAWNAVPEATHYQIYRSTSLDGTRIIIGSWQTATTFNDGSVEPETEYYYWVRAAADATGSRASELSEPDSGWMAASEVVPTADYKIVYRRCTFEENTLTTGSLVFKTTSPASWVKIIRLPKGKPAKAVDRPGRIAYRTLPALPILRIEGDMRSLYSMVEIERLETSGTLRSLTGKGANIALVSAGSLGTVRITAYRNSSPASAGTAAEFASTSIYSTQPGNPVSVLLTGTILADLKSAQPFRFVKASTKLYRVKTATGRERRISLGGIGSVARVVEEAYGVVSSEPTASNSALEAPAIGLVQVTGGPVVCDRIAADVQQVRALSAQYRIPASKSQPVVLQGNVRVSEIVSGIAIRKIEARATRASGTWVGGSIGHLDDFSLLRVVAPDLGTIWGDLGVSGRFIAGTDDAGQPNCQGKIGKFGTKNGVGAFRGQAYCVKMPLFSPEKGLDFEVFLTPPVQ